MFVTFLMYFLYFYSILVSIIYFTDCKLKKIHFFLKTLVWCEHACSCRQEYSIVYMQRSEKSYTKTTVHYFVRICGWNLGPQACTEVPDFPDPLANQSIPFVYSKQILFFVHLYFLDRLLYKLKFFLSLCFELFFPFKSQNYFHINVQLCDNTKLNC